MGYHFLPFNVDKWIYPYRNVGVGSVYLCYEKASQDYLTGGTGWTQSKNVGKWLQFCLDLDRSKQNCSHFADILDTFFIEWKRMHFEYDFTEICSSWSH